MDSSIEEHSPEWWRLNLLRAIERVTDDPHWSEHDRAKQLKALRNELSLVERRLARVGQLELIGDIIPRVLKKT